MMVMTLKDTMMKSSMKITNVEGNDKSDDDIDDNYESDDDVDVDDSSVCMQIPLPLP